jgi:hypothetical protein
LRLCWTAVFPLDLFSGPNGGVLLCDRFLEIFDELGDLAWGYSSALVTRLNCDIVEWLR